MAIARRKTIPTLQRVFSSLSLDCLPSLLNEPDSRKLRHFFTVVKTSLSPWELSSPPPIKLRFSLPLSAKDQKFRLVVRPFFKSAAWGRNQLSERGILIHHNRKQSQKSLLLHSLPALIFWGCMRKVLMPYPVRVVCVGVEKSKEKLSSDP